MRFLLRKKAMVFPQGIFIPILLIFGFITTILAEYTFQKSCPSTQDDVEENTSEMTIECVLLEGMVFEKDNQKVHKLQLHGDNIQFSDIPDDWYNLCEGRIGIIEIFARNSIVIDKNFDGGEETLQFVAIAPSMLVVGDRKIRLDGAPGREQKPANTGSPGRKGHDGQAGLPGEPGGIFIGISEKIVFGNKLRISANGGPGGPGQQGGQGGKTPFPMTPTENDYDLREMPDNGMIFCQAYYYRFQPGSMGGNGGKGGIGGNPGKIYFFVLGQIPREYDPKPLPGISGENGKGGDGSEGKTSIHTTNIFCGLYSQIVHSKRKSPKNGIPGLTGRSYLPNRKPPRKFRGFRDFGLVVNDYKNFIRPHLTESKILSRFYEGLTTDEYINAKYGTFALLDELKGLEQQSSCLTKIVDLLPMYDNLGERIRRYAKSQPDSEKSNEYVAALAYAYTAIVAISNRMRENSVFVTDVRKYVNLVKSNFDKLHCDQMKYYANLLEHNYNGDIETKIEEAKLIIETQLRPEIDKINRIMKDQVFELINQIGDLANSYEKKRELEKRKLLFSILMTVIAGSALFVPGGQIAIGIAVSLAAIDIAEPFFTEPSAVGNNLIIPEKVKGTFSESYKFVEDMKMHQRQNVEQQVPSMDFGRVKRESRGKSRSRTKDSNRKRDKKNDVPEKTRIDKEIRQLKKIQEKIYGELIPVFDNIFRDLPSHEILDGQSVVALDVSKWKVQSALKNLKMYVKQITQGFKVADEMNLLVESLQDTMDILINMYDHIQNYQQESKLATYMKKLNSGELLNYYSNNTALENSLLEIRIMIEKNLALDQYNRVFIAFKQFVFPFAEEYLSDLITPSEFELSQTSAGDPTDSHLISEISKNIVKIGNKIEETGASIQKGKTDSIFHESLVYDNEHGGAVYLWRNELYNEIISNLLMGKEVILSPDVTKFAHYALKARKIMIRFLAINRSDQEAVDQKLKSMRMKMTHMGISYYTCGEKIYSISHSSFSLEVKFDQTHGGQSENAMRLASGVDLVSPFAMWRVQIFKFNGEIEENELSDLMNRVHLVLEAPIATYILNTTNGPCKADTDLSKYYEPYYRLTDD